MARAMAVCMALILAACFSGARTAEEYAVRDSLSMERALTSAIEQTMVGGDTAKAIFAIQGLKQEWFVFNTRYQGFDQSGSMSREVDSRIERAARDIETRRMANAHKEIVGIRPLLRKCRESAGIRFFPDMLAAYSEALDQMAMPPDAVAFEALKANWEALKDNAPSAGLYRLTPRASNLLAEQMAAEDKTMEALDAAIQAKDSPRARRHAGELIGPVRAMLRVFGEQAGEK